MEWQIKVSVPLGTRAGLQGNLTDLKSLQRNLIRQPAVRTVWYFNRGCVTSTFEPILPYHCVGLPLCWNRLMWAKVWQISLKTPVLHLCKASKHWAAIYCCCFPNPWVTHKPAVDAAPTVPCSGHCNALAHLILEDKLHCPEIRCLVRGPSLGMSTTQKTRSGVYVYITHPIITWLSQLQNSFHLIPFQQHLSVFCFHHSC